MTDSDEEISKQDEYSVELDEKAGQRPAEEDEKDTEGKCDGSFQLMWTGEKGESLLKADDESQPDEEKDLDRRESSC